MMRLIICLLSVGLATGVFLAKDLTPMTCTFNKVNNVKFLGTVTGSVANISLPQDCAAACFQANAKGVACKSANFIKTDDKCELMKDVFDRDSKMGEHVNVYLENTKSSLYVVPTSCKADGKTEQVVPPTKSKDATYNSASFAGTCGNTRFPNRDAALVSNVTTTRIVGGVEARPHSMPWIISMQELGQPFCGGTLLRCSNKDESNLIVTAAHCVKQPGREEDLNPNDMTVNFGEHSLTGKEAGEVHMRVKTYEFNKLYDEGTSENDIAVVQLKTPVKFSDTVQPACLPQVGEKVPPAGTKCIVAGWGTTSEGGRQSDKLMQVIAPILSDQDCAQPMYYGSEFVPSKMFCAGYKEGQKDSCQGDSGGPYVCYKDKSATLFGVVSFGQGCARSTKPGVYVRVANYLPWIDEMKAKYCSK